MEIAVEFMSLKKKYPIKGNARQRAQETSHLGQRITEHSTVTC